MEKIYVVMSRTSDGSSCVICDTTEEAKAGYMNFFDANPNADIKILEFPRTVLYQSIAANFRLSACLNDGTVINPFTLSQS